MEHAPFVRELPSGITIRQTAAEHADQLEELQKKVFPTLSTEELFKAPHYKKHIELFRAGQFVATDGASVVGMTSTMRTTFDFDHPHHTFAELIDGGWLTKNDPQGQWMYGVDIGVDPTYRGQAIGRALYAARQQAAQKLGLLGQVTVGMLSGYGAVRNEISVDDYYAELVQGDRFDPTVSVQMRIGFEPRGLISEYVNDPVCDGYGVLLVLPSTAEIAWPDKAT